MAFTCFSKLPTEIRQAIWLLCIPADEPEVCLLWPVILHERYEGPRGVQASQPLLVDTGFPAAMHVCAESRAVLQDTQRSKLLFRFSPAAGCPVPYRAFRPALDTLYWGGENWEAMTRDVATFSETAKRMPVLREVQSLAMEIRHGCQPVDAWFESRALFLPALRTLSLVLADSTTSLTGSQPMGFRPPARRCKLWRIPCEAGSRVMAHHSLLGTAADAAVEVPLWPTVMGVAAERLQLDPERTHELTTYELDFEGWPGLEKTCEAYEPELVADTFVEYQRDGSWKQVCAERMFVEHGEMVRSGAYVPYDERPDPRLVRVNDVDGEFDVVYDPGSDEDSWDGYW